jgi:hypothetical protein
MEGTNPRFTQSSGNLREVTVCHVHFRLLLCYFAFAIAATLGLTAPMQKSQRTL